jgi:PKD repeat protein
MTIYLGNYSIKLTVKDKEGLTDTTSASLTVVKENDYPPTAIAGEDKIVFLPQVYPSL